MAHRFKFVVENDTPKRELRPEDVVGGHRTGFEMDPDSTLMKGTDSSKKIVTTDLN